jgi:hypothetical protein
MIPSMKNIERPVEGKGKLKDEEGKTVMIYTHAIPAFFSEPFPFLLGFFSTWKILGAPWPEGWADWPSWAVDTILALKEIENDR